MVTTQAAKKNAERQKEKLPKNTVVRSRADRQPALGPRARRRQMEREKADREAKPPSPNSKKRAAARRRARKLSAFFFEEDDARISPWRWRVPGDEPTPRKHPSRLLRPSATARQVRTMMKTMDHARTLETECFVLTRMDRPGDASFFERAKKYEDAKTRPGPSSSVDRDELLAFLKLADPAADQRDADRGLLLLDFDGSGKLRPWAARRYSRPSGGLAR